MGSRALHNAVRHLAPSFAYVVPDNHNPTGLTMPQSQREELAALLDEHLPDWQPCPGGGGLALWVRLRCR